MDANGVLASMCFPTFAGFNGMNLARSGADDRELTNAVVSAYNDWHIDEWAGEHPGRFLPLAIGQLLDFDALVAEIRPGRGQGLHRDQPARDAVRRRPARASSATTGIPCSPRCCDEDIVVCMHIGGAFGLIQRPDGAPPDHLIILAPQLSALTANDLIISGTFRRFPTLKVALSEGGIGWIPFYLDRLDRHVDNQRWTGLDDRRRRAATRPTCSASTSSAASSPTRPRCASSTASAIERHRVGVRLPALRLDVAATHRR